MVENGKRLQVLLGTFDTLMKGWLKMSPLGLLNGKSLFTPSIDSTRSAQEGLISSPKHLEVAHFPLL